MNHKRRHDLDWLRIFAFTVLIYFHAAIIFIPGGLPLLQNDQTSVVLQWFVSFSHQWRLALLFFVSGAGVGFALRHRTDRQFVCERSRRLLIPLLFGVLVVVPPMVYVEKLSIGAFDGSLWAFWPAFFTEGVYPGGNLSWHHLWFVAYLYLFCLMGLRVFRYLDDEDRSGWLRHKATTSAVYQFIVPLFVVELSLRAFFPGFRDLIHDWASFFHWFLMMLAGYLCAKDTRILDNVMRYRSRSLLLAVVATMLLFAGFSSEDGIYLDPNETNILYKYIVYCAVRMTMVWCWILAAVGYAARYLQFGHRTLDYLNEAVYPLFILHLTTSTIIGYFVVQWPINLWLKYLAITTLTLLGVLMTYHWLIRPYDSMRLLFGVKPRIAR